MTEFYDEQEPQSTPGFLRFRPSESFQEEMLAPILTPEAIEQRRKVSSGLLLSSVAINSYLYMPREGAIDTLHRESLRHFRKTDRIYANNISYEPQFHSEINTATNEYRRMVHGFDIRFLLDIASGDKLSDLVNPNDAESYFEHFGDGSRELHFKLNPQELAFPPRETKARLDDHVAIATKKLADQSLKSSLYINSDPNILMNRLA